VDPVESVKEKFAGDVFPQSLGITLEELSPGHSKVSMVLAPHMVNFHNIGHGGAIFTLADTAFGLASNSRGKKAVALTVTINYISPAVPGARLTATASEQCVQKKTAVYDITVADENNRVIALARGTCYYLLS